jgi:phosphate transport system protein
MRENYTEQLEELSQRLFAMGELVQEAIRGTASALHSFDTKLAQDIIEADSQIDRKEKEIESACFHLLLQQNPMAGDFRQVSAALKMITDLERIGDHASDISEMILLLSDNNYEGSMKNIEKMSELTAKMLSESVNAFVEQDLEKAMLYLQKDDEVDDLFLTTKEEIARNVQEHPDTAMQELDLLMIAKYYERIGDHAENIAEWVVFSITGEHKKERVI